MFVPPSICCAISPAARASAIALFNVFNSNVVIKLGFGEMGRSGSSTSAAVSTLSFGTKATLTVWLMIAARVSATIGVVARHLVALYLVSPVYRGSGEASARSTASGEA